MKGFIDKIKGAFSDKGDVGAKSTPETTSESTKTETEKEGTEKKEPGKEETEKEEAGKEGSEKEEGAKKEEAKKTLKEKIAQALKDLLELLGISDDKSQITPSGGHSFRGPAGGEHGHMGGSQGQAPIIIYTHSSEKEKAPLTLDDKIKDITGRDVSLGEKIDLLTALKKDTLKELNKEQDKPGAEVNKVESMAKLDKAFEPIKEAYDKNPALHTKELSDKVGAFKEIGVQQQNTVEPGSSKAPPEHVQSETKSQERQR